MSIDEEVKDVVVEITKNRRLFTAHDVTKLVRHNVDGENVPHNDVKREVHSLFDNDEMGIYERTQIRLGSGGSPFVYHLNHQNPNQDYDKDWVSKTTNPTVAPTSGFKVVALGTRASTPSQNVSSPVSGSIMSQVPTSALRTAANATVIAKKARYSFDSGTEVHSVTKEGRLNIPVKMLKNISSANLVVLDDTVNINGQFCKALVVSNNSNGAIKTYAANTDGRVRISRKFLNKLGAGNDFRIKVVGGDVVIIED